MSTIPIISSAADMSGAIRHAERNPSSRWYVAKRAHALGMGDRVPASWGLTASFGGDWAAPDLTPRQAGGKIEAMTAAAGWDNHLHPRDRNGRFIEANDLLDIFDVSGGTTPSARGIAVGNGTTPDGKDFVEYRVLGHDGKPIGSTHQVPVSQVESAPPAKAHLDAPGGGGQDWYEAEGSKGFTTNPDMARKDADGNPIKRGTPQPPVAKPDLADPNAGVDDSAGEAPAESESLLNTEHATDYANWSNELSDALGEYSLDMSDVDPSDAEAAYQDGQSPMDFAGQLAQSMDEGGDPVVPGAGDLSGLSDDALADMAKDPRYKADSSGANLSDVQDSIRSGDYASASQELNSIVDDLSLNGDPVGNLNDLIDEVNRRENDRSMNEADAQPDLAQQVADQAAIDDGSGIGSGTLSKTSDGSTTLSDVAREDLQPLADLLNVDSGDGAWASGLSEYQLRSLHDSVDTWNEDPEAVGDWEQEKLSDIHDFAEKHGISDLTDVIDTRIAAMQLGWAQEEQLHNILSGEPLDDQNPAALSNISDFLNNNALAHHDFGGDGDSITMQELAGDISEYQNGAFESAHDASGISYNGSEGDKANFRSLLDDELKSRGDTGLADWGGTADDEIDAAYDGKVSPADLADSLMSDGEAPGGGSPAGPFQVGNSGDPLQDRGELYRDADGNEVWRIHDQNGNVVQDGIASDHDAAAIAQEQIDGEGMADEAAAKGGAPEVADGTGYTPTTQAKIRDRYAAMSDQELVDEYQFQRGEEQNLLQSGSTNMGDGQLHKTEFRTDTLRDELEKRGLDNKAARQGQVNKAGDASSAPEAAPSAPSDAPAAPEADPNLTDAAKRDLEAMRAGKPVNLKHGPYKQLLDAGYIEGEHGSHTLTDKGRGSAPAPSDAPAAPGAPAAGDPAAAGKLALMSRSAEKESTPVSPDEATARLNGILDDATQGRGDKAHKDLAKLMTELKLGGKQRKRYRELLDAHMGTSDDSSAETEAAAVADNLRDDNPVKEKLAAKAAAGQGGSAPATDAPAAPAADAPSKAAEDQAYVSYGDVGKLSDGALDNNISNLSALAQAGALDKTGKAQLARLKREKEKRGAPDAAPAAPTADAKQALKDKVHGPAAADPATMSDSDISAAMDAESAKYKAEHGVYGQTPRMKQLLAERDKRRREMLMRGEGPKTTIKTPYGDEVRAGDVITYRDSNGNLHRMVVEEVTEDIKHGEPGVMGVLVDNNNNPIGDEFASSKWGYADQVSSVIQKAGTGAAGKA